MEDTIKCQLLYSGGFVGGVKFLLLLELKLDDDVCYGFISSERNNALHPDLG